MSLPPGQRLGPYEVIARVGAGGMGEVYRATDTRLHRTVAIKVLSADETSRPDFSARFEREARAISSFSHPHICTVYDFGLDGPFHYLVMEYLDGETLADRLRRGPLRFDEFIRYSLHIADALVQAHRQGHLHRDIKPANVMLTKSGAKLLDFGLTRAIRYGARNDQETRTQALTTNGAIVGTYPYMSPEQLQGREVDVRSDLFSFGAVLYEMATGDRAFAGDSAASVIAAVLEREPPPVSKRRPELPPEFEWIIHTCLRKDPEERWQTVHDLKLQIERLRDSASSPLQQARAPATWKRWRDLGAGVLAGAVLAATAVFLYSDRASPTSEAARAILFEIAPPAGTSFTTAGSASVPVISSAVSPDGSKLAFIAERGGVSTIWTRQLNESTARSLPGTEGAQQPFWSPDSRWLGFFAENALKKIELSGGPAISLCEVSIDPRGGAWLSSNVIVFAPSSLDGLMQIATSGGQPKAVYPKKEAAQRWWPSPLPDSRGFIYFDRKKNAVFAGSIDGKESEPLVRTDWAAVYVDPGYLLYFANGVLIAHSFDSRSGTLRGEPVHLDGGIGAATNAMPGFSASRTGILTHSPLLVDRTQIAWYDRRGGVPAQVTEPAYYMDPVLSWDGQKIAWSRLDLLRSAQDIWIHDRMRGVTTRFTADPLLEASPLWSGNGREVLFRSNRTGVINLYIRDVNGGAERALFQSEEQRAAHGGAPNTVPTSWSSDGRHVIYTVSARTGYDIFTLPLHENRLPQPLAKSPFNEMHGVLSPDGRWLAFASDETGRLEVYVQSFPDAKGKQQISASGGWEPRWRADSRELYFLSNSSKLSAVSFSITGSAGKPQDLMAAPTPPPSPFKSNYYPSADGQRFLMNALADKDRSAVITVVANWRELLRR